MKFSIIVPYRNRELLRVKRCIDSLARQSCQDFEFCFVDFGSDSEFAKEMKSLCAKYDFVNYIYSETRGRFWNRSYALNTGIRHAQGEYIVTVDIDMIYSANFMEIITQKAQKNKLVHYQCYYLSQNFKSYETIGSLNLDSLKLSNPEAAKGLFVVEKKILHSIQGFDQFYKIWGMEDMDMSMRLDYLGLEIEWLAPELSPVFHQWHPISHEEKRTPRDWQQLCLEHYYAKEKEDIRCQNPDWGKILLASERPILDAIKTQSKTTFSFQRPIESTYNSFFLAFNKLEKGEILSIEQSFDVITPSDSPSSLARLFGKFNKLIAKSSFSYRITDLAGHEREIIDFHTTRDFLFYFLHHNRNYFDDYYWDVQKPTIKLSILK